MRLICPATRLMEAKVRLVLVRAGLVSGRHYTIFGPLTDPQTGDRTLHVEVWEALPSDAQHTLAALPDVTMLPDDPD